METIRAYFKNPLVAILVGVVAGLLLGLIIGWGIWPVKWVDAGPGQLSDGWKADFLSMAIASYGQTHDVAQAKERFEALGKGNQKVLEQVAKEPKGLDPAVIAEFSAVTGAQAPVVEQPGAGATPGAPVTTPGAAGPTTPEPAATTGAGESKPGGGSNVMLYLGLLCLVLLIALGVAAYFMFFRNRFAGSTAGPTAATLAAEARKAAVPTDYTATGTEPPTAQFMASYKLGDDLFDDSFSIDSQSSEFLGECGVGISENIGVGEPKKVSAFEVWLFDKNDIQTVTKVLMAPRAYDDPSIRQRLEAKGETVLAQPGAEFVLETQTLTMVARVVDMSYGEGAMPPESYFDHLLLELAIWQKPA